MKTRLTGVLLLLLSLTGCVRETLDKCPERNVRINVYAEKFQTNTAAVTQQVEEEIGKRIRFLHCVLYCEDIYVMDTLIENISGVNVSLVPIDFGELPFGRYNLVIIGNCKSDAMEGDFHRWGGMSLLYLGADRTDDMFGAFLSFTVDCNCALQFETKLRRLLGVVSCEIKGIPDEVTEFEVIFHRVNSRLSEGGNYDTPVDVSKRFQVVRTRSVSPQRVLMGIFPTVEDRPASYELKFYAGGRTDPVFDKVIYQQVEIVRNQLIELITDFSTGEMHLTVRMDTKWEDYIDGGGIEIF